MDIAFSRITGEEEQKALMDKEKQIPKKLNITQRIYATFEEP